MWFNTLTSSVKLAVSESQLTKEQFSQSLKSGFSTKLHCFILRSLNNAARMTGYSDAELMDF